MPNRIVGTGGVGEQRFAEVVGTKPRTLRRKIAQTLSGAFKTCTAHGRHGSIPHGGHGRGHRAMEGGRLTTLYECLSKRVALRERTTREGDPTSRTSRASSCRRGACSAREKGAEYASPACRAAWVVRSGRNDAMRACPSPTTACSGDPACPIERGGGSSRRPEGGQCGFRHERIVRSGYRRSHASP